jgi:D-beta-D-heptose 7-phosphate kinase/D-beta-D-heptose 1-phosphate adenosyltransferase
MRIVVVGDCLLDVDVVGSASRLGPDGPAAVVDVQETRERAGGAGLVATMLARDGVEVDLVTALGSDAAAASIVRALDGVRVHGGGLDGRTPVKTRVRADGQTVVRLDSACADLPSVQVDESRLDCLDAADAIVASDYGRGVLESPAVRARLEAVASRTPVVWDPHPRGGKPVPGVALATPNRVEASIMSGLPVTRVGEAAAAAALLREHWDAWAVAVTLGDLGAVLDDGGEVPVAVPAADVRVLDACGAGDRLASEAAVRLARGDVVREAVRCGVQRATAFLRAGGVASLEHPRIGEPTAGAPDALAVADATRAAGGTVVATGGCFDLLHAGHVRTLEAARALGDCLIVALNSDASVHRLKGDGRPIMAEQDRVDLLLALECVDAVLVFEEDTPAEAVRRIAPDLWVKGGDYEADRLPESAAVAEHGGRTVTVPYHPARSTSALAAALAAIG